MHRIGVLSPVKMLCFGERVLTVQIRSWKGHFRCGNW